MIIDERYIEFYKKVASKEFLPMTLSDYGVDVDTVTNLTDKISNIYKYLKYNTFQTVIIYSALNSSSQLKTIGANPTRITSFETLVPLNGTHIVIEIRVNGELDYAIDFDFDLNTVRQNAIIYKFDKTAETETFFGKVEERVLPPIPDSDSYYAIQTYKDLDVALEDYGTKVARLSECVYLSSSWADTSMIFFKPGPEHILRDSLTQFLKNRLRNTEVRPEQIVDKSHPVDIKVTWNLATHLALIEIKWLGKSLQTSGTRRIKKIYTRQRALDGAEQLANYLDENLRQSPVKTTKGYLAIFDARRWQCNKNTTTVNRADGTKYENDTINFNPDYHVIRTDFAKPFRFFMMPKIS